MNHYRRYHNDRMINYDSERGITVTKDGTGSTMTLSHAEPGDSGNYTCSPYNIRAASVMVHVLSEGNSAAAVQNNESEKTKQNQQPPSAAVHSSASICSRTSILVFVVYFGQL